MAVALTMAGLALADQAKADSVTWSGSLSSDWGDNGNWIGHTPGAADSAAINAATTSAPTISLSESATASTLVVGGSSNGTLTVNGALATTNVLLGNDSNSTSTSGAVTVSGNNASWTNSDAMTVGSSSAGSLLISNGASVSTNTLDIGTVTGSTGGVTLTGSGSSLTVTQGISLGTAGSSLTVENGATLSTIGPNGDLEIQHGGTMTIAGRGTAVHIGTLHSGTPATWNDSDGWFILGYGTATVSDGASLESDGGYIRGGTDGTATMTVSGSGTVWNSHLGLYVGGDGNGSGLRGDGRLTISDGAAVTASVVAAGNDPGTTGAILLTGAGSSLAAVASGTFLGNVYAGYVSSGIITVRNGASLTAANELRIGYYSGSSGTFNIGAAEGETAAAAPAAVSAVKAVFGEGSGALVFNHTSPGFTFSTPITTMDSSSSGTIKALAGTTTLSGDVSGDIDLIVSGGGLAIASSSYAGRSATVSPGASLAVTSGNPVTLSSAYTQTGGTLTLGNGSKLVLSGTSGATVSNTAIIYSGTGLSTGSSYVLIDTNAASSYTGNTLSLRGAHGMAGELSTADNGHDLIFTITANSYAMIGRTLGANTAAMGGTLDSLANRASLSADMTSILDGIDMLSSTGAKASAIKQLVPSQTTSSAQMSNSAATAVLGAVEQHQQTAMAYDPATGKAAGSEAAYRDALWGQLLGGGAIRSSTAETDGWRMKEFGLASGFDHMFTDELMGGVAFSWMRTFANGSGSSATASRLDSYQATLYGTWRVGSWFVDGQTGVGYNRFHQKREIAFLNRTATADFDGAQYLLRGQTGYDFPLGGGVKVTPLAGLTYLHAANDGYTEGGAGAANLSVSSQGVDSLSHDLGGKIGWSVDTGWGRLKPELRLEWVHDYRQAAVIASGSLGGAAFATATPRLSPDGAQIGLAVALEGTDNLSFRAEYTGELRPSYQGHTGMVKATWSF